MEKIEIKHPRFETGCCVACCPKFALLRDNDGRIWRITFDGDYDAQPVCFSEASETAAV